MALAAIVKASAGKGGAPVTTVSGRTSWGKAVLDSLGGSVQSGADMIRPLSVSSSNIAPVEMGAVSTRIIVRGAYNADATGGSHAGKVRVYAVFGEPVVTSGAHAWSDALPNRVVRITGSTTPITLTIDTTNDVRDTTYKYTDPVVINSTELIDALGASYILVLLETQSDVSGGSTPEAFVEVGVL